jgi:predicted nucleic acid-binding protein
MRGEIDSRGDIVRALDLEWEAMHAATLAGVLGDPVDCFLAATALVHGATLLTADTRLLESRVVDVVDARR